MRKTTIPTVPLEGAVQYPASACLSVSPTLAFPTHEGSTLGPKVCNIIAKRPGGVQVRRSQQARRRSGKPGGYTEEFRLSQTGRQRQRN